ncbi:annexin [Trichophyton mentagrophytes]|uniref:Annexin ANXC4 n=1 Tax=Trichophyton interdigitale (strain MR816) TaxID=1215338 RepID=A0A059J5W2_TRIIM|nr:hypothetical protein H101_04989 [Trichophyton interdigitale H6]KAG5206013.1 Annexin [Trichophyton interdigitale]KDB23083.1 hypothetical protein H109_05041 [Trichophyton interdigitale MR816]GBF59502.1 annexin [Trichophyton mentagrophytes]KAG5217492.1 Annexin [Trichophyton interdigitale]
MSLRIPDQYYRSRSKSRERSRSRHGREHDHTERSHSRSHSHVRRASPSREREKPSKKYYDYDSYEDEVSRRTSSRRMSTQYREVSPSDDERYRPSRSSKYSTQAANDHYYLSDEHALAPRYSSSSKPSKSKQSSYIYDSHSDIDAAPATKPPAVAYPSARPSRLHEPAYYSESEDDHLAYGEPYDYPLARNHHRRLRSRSRSRGRRPADPKVTFDSDSSYEYTKEYTADRRRYSRSRTRESPRHGSLFEPEQAPGPAGSSARDEMPPMMQKTQNYGLSSTLEKLKSQLYPSTDTKDRRFDEKPSDIDLNAWAEIPECEREGYVPPAAEKQPAAAPQPHNDNHNNHPEVPNIYANLTQYYQLQQQPMVASTAPVATAPELPPRPQTSTYTRPIPSVIPGATVASPAASTTQYPSIPAARYVPPQYSQTPATAQTLAPKPEHKRATSTGHIPTKQTYSKPDVYQYSVPASQIRYSTQTPAPTAAATTNNSNHTAPPPAAAAAAATKPSKVQYTTAPVTQPKQPSYLEIKPRRQTISSKPSNLNLTPDNQMKIPGSFPDGTNPPASPLLEPYKGTYQSISPIQWPTSLGDDALSDMEPLNGKESKTLSRKASKKDRKKREDPGLELEIRRRLSTSLGPSVIKEIAPKEAQVYVYDPKDDAKLVHSALNHSKINAKTLIKILPYLTSDEILDLRGAYKNLRVMTRKGVNMAKHIKMVIPGNFGKVCYATALGQWESEALWANFWYQSSRTRHELLIESLIGRPNAEIKEIKACFRDKRYQDNLELCMQTELKADKFRVAVLLALQEKRQPDNAPLNVDLVRRDVYDLHRALTSRDGGETAMIQIIIVRGNSHLREVLQAYEMTYRENFTRAMLSKSRNLVGETLGHILNGVRNRPMRDALLIHQAITESGTGRDRAELLISRLVRLHWEPHHLERVKSEYRRKYGRFIEDHIEEEIIEVGGAGAHEKKTEWADFCVELVKSSSFHVENEEP